MTNGSKARILIVDDERAMRDLLMEFLQDCGYETLEAADGKAALKILEEEPVDVAIVDIFMPEMDGIQLLSEMRTRTLGTRVIAVSGGGELEFPELPLRMASMLGAFACLEKPFDLDVLRGEVERSLTVSGG